MVKIILHKLKNWMHASECLFLILLHLSSASLRCFSQSCSSSSAVLAIWNSVPVFFYQLSNISFRLNPYLGSLDFAFTFLLILLVFISEMVYSESLRFILKRIIKRRKNLQIYVIVDTLTFLILTFSGQFM